ncbi:MAG TPA: ABC transporter ATP-binding protein [Gemmatimonadales bacterium]|nr:ABC transporter ATP-binding protein [Gemmatimonadales bacterium]
MPRTLVGYPTVSHPTTIAVRLERVTKSYGRVRAVDGVSLEIVDGEFFSILGPSGCGKTTLLRLVAGFETPDPGGGQVLLFGEPADHLRPYERPVGLVFQNYALFPHLSVERNVAFGLEERRRPRSEIADRVRAALELVRLDPVRFAGRMPAQLSGGQRQRVALARALVLEPRILLLDEPLGALDLKLRKEMQVELRALNRTLGTTFIYVTHDQEEALTMSDRIAVMDHARLVQTGPPAAIYERPRTAFVATFIGDANLLEGGRVALRPERVRLFPPGTPSDGLVCRPGVVQDALYRGDTVQVIVSLEEGGTIRASVDCAAGNAGSWRPGDGLIVGWRSADCHPLEADP